MVAQINQTGRTGQDLQTRTHSEWPDNWVELLPPVLFGDGRAEYFETARLDIREGVYMWPCPVAVLGDLCATEAVEPQRTRDIQDCLESLRTTGDKFSGAPVFLTDADWQALYTACRVSFVDLVTYQLARYESVASARSYFATMPRVPYIGREEIALRLDITHVAVYRPVLHALMAGLNDPDITALEIGFVRFEAKGEIELRVKAPREYHVEIARLLCQTIAQNAPFSARL